MEKKDNRSPSKSFYYLGWFNQFSYCYSCLDDDEEGEEGEEGEEKMPSCGDYIMHFLTLPWKLLFALIPPTGEYKLYSPSTRQNKTIKI